MGGLSVSGAAVFIAGVSIFLISLVFWVDYIYGAFGGYLKTSVNEPVGVVLQLGILWGPPLVVIGLGLLWVSAWWRDRATIPS